MEVHVKKLLTLALGVVIAVAITGTSRQALAEEACTGTIGEVAIDDDVVVPDGATCVLEGTVVDGNILVEPNATLRADGVEVGGNVQTDDGGAAHVTVVNSEVDGNVQVFDSSVVVVDATTSGGNIQLEGNDDDLTVSDNTVDGDVQLFDNDGGAKVVIGNSIGGNLQCEGNDPAPSGGDNQVEGDAEGQCSDLGGAAPPPPDDTRFVDVAGSNVFAADIEALAASGITVGCNPPVNDRFCPQEPVERQQMAAFLVRALDLPAGSASFVDVSTSSVFAADIAALADAGITVGCNPPVNDRFCPEEPVERQQMAAFLVRAGLTG